MSIEVVVVGAGGFGREALDVIEANNSIPARERILVRGVVDDAPSAANLERLERRGYPYLGTLRSVLKGAPGTYVLGIGAPAIKRAIAKEFDGQGWTAASVIHPGANVSASARIGAGAIICGGVQLSTGTALGKHVHLNPNCTVGHDTELADFVSVNPGATVSGDVQIGAGVLVGAGAVVLQGLRIGSGVVIGAAACVTKNAAADLTLVGVPARAR